MQFLSVVNSYVRHSALKGFTPNIKISEHNQNLYSKECFFSYPNNKKELISFLSTSFKADCLFLFAKLMPIVKLLRLH